MNPQLFNEDIKNGERILGNDMTFTTHLGKG